MTATSCGVLVTDGARLLLGHAARSPRWDIPKGLAEPGESFLAAAVRELREETGIEVAATELSGLGIHRYLKGKDLALFAWRPSAMPDPSSLRCASLAQFADGVMIPELDRFGIFDWDGGVALVGRNLARVLTAVRPAI